MYPQVCSLCWPCRAQERGRGRLDRLELGPGVCQDSGEGAGQGGGSVHGRLMPSLTSWPPVLLWSLLWSQAAHCSLPSDLRVTVTHCAAPLLAPTDCTMSALSPVTSGQWPAPASASAEAPQSSASPAAVSSLSTATGTTINTEAGPPLGLRTGSNFYPGHMGE